MDTLFSARALMGLSLFFHTFFTPIGIGLPLLLFITEGIGLKTGDPRYRQLARSWTPVVGLLFAVGAVSGTVLSFELGLLWPEFMDEAGGVIGMPFSLEGFAFFTEAIFLAIYIYGWNRLSPRVHWLTGIPLFVAAGISAVFVISANAWMNSPDGFDVAANGEFTNIDPWDAFFNAAWAHEAIHGTLAAYVVTGFSVAAVYAVLMLRGHRDSTRMLGLQLAMGMAAVAIPLQIIAGDFAARRVNDLQPEKFAAMEGQTQTREGAPFVIGGLIIDGELKGAIEIPNALSLLMDGDPDSTITGLDAFPEDERPMEGATHLSFQVMVASGFAMLAIAIWFWIWRWRRGAGGDPGRWLLRAVGLAGFLSYVAIQAGWFVTEFGRQPWTIYGVLRTEDAVTTREGIDLVFIAFTLLYVVISAGLIYALLKWPRGEPSPGGARGQPQPGTPGRTPDVA